MSEFHRHIKFETLDLRFDKRDRSVEAYAQRPWYEEYNSNFYTHIAKQLQPDLLLDIGANFGVASVFMKNKMPDVQLLSLEPNPDLLPYIEFNLNNNNFTKYEIIQAVVGKESAENVTFHINPAGSQDSRVIAGGEGWPQVITPQVTLSQMIDKQSARRVFIKIDSQGYEESIFAGGDSFLSSSTNWLIKTEFAPHWLKSQGTDPAEFLRYLVSKFTVSEFPARYDYFTNYQNIMERSALKLSDVDSYLKYVVQLNRFDRGWVDLLIAPKAH